jgi:hypothetical protein
VRDNHGKEWAEQSARHSGSIGISGRFVTKAHAARSGCTTIVEGTKPSRSPGGRARSAISGRYVTVKHAQRSPRTTVIER